MGNLEIGVEMQEIYGDIWEQYKLGRWVVITTNGATRKDGACVMGRGVAKQAANKFPKLPYRLGVALREGGNNVYTFSDLKIITLPVKHHWSEPADIDLVERSLQQLLEVWTCSESLYLVRPGCSNGRRDWETEIKPLCERYLDDRFTIVEWGD